MAVHHTELTIRTQGQGTFTMELACYRRVPAKIQEEIVAERKKGELLGAKRHVHAIAPATRHPEFRIVARRRWP